jgi:hypothetical protein
MYGDVKVADPVHVGEHDAIRVTGNMRDGL